MSTNLRNVTLICAVPILLGVALATGLAWPRPLIPQPPWTRRPSRPRAALLPSMDREVNVDAPAGYRHSGYKWYRKITGNCQSRALASKRSVTMDRMPVMKAHRRRTPANCSNR